MYSLPAKDEQFKLLLAQSRKWPDIYYKLCILCVRFVNTDRRFTVVYNMFKNMNDSDSNRYRILRKHIKRPKFNGWKDMTYKMHPVQARIHKYIKSPSIDRYLDFGCGKCDSTYALGKLMGASIVCGTDVEDTFVASWSTAREENTQVDFRYSTPEDVVPFDDVGPFDLVTCFMVLHHIQDVDHVVQELSRAIRPGGIFVLREHNCGTDTDKLFADVIHSLYIVQQEGDNYIEKIKEQQIYYRDIYAWDQLLIKHKLVRISDIDHDICESNIYPTRDYMSIYTKAL
jgi:SAM-dependent methyltransferase